MKFKSFMQEALEQAEIAFKKDEVPVGCVIVDNNGEIIAKAFNQNIGMKDATAHAEILAIRKACKRLGSDRLINCVLYVTLEPCSMCTTAISYAGIKSLYYGASNPKEGAIEHGAKLYKNKFCNYIPEVYGGILEDECGEILKRFFKGKR
jgi:tRNA(adenine34) deaminase